MFLYTLVYKSIVSIPSQNVSGRINVVSKYDLQIKETSKKSKNEDQFNYIKEQQGNKVNVSETIANKSIESDATYQNKSFAATTFRYLKTP